MTFAGSSETRVIATTSSLRVLLVSNDFKGPYNVRHSAVEIAGAVTNKGSSLPLNASDNRRSIMPAAISTHSLAFKWAITSRNLNSKIAFRSFGKDNK